MKPKKELFIRCALILISILLVLFGFELALRKGNFSFKNLILDKEKNLLEGNSKGLFQYDSNLGWSIKENIEFPKWETTVHTLTDGIRSNGSNLPLKDRPLILAVGDSFTFGDEAADNETWPAYLERLLQVRVLNAGVSSSGLDQIVLHAEQIVPKYKPDILIVSIIYDDILRCREVVRHGVPKPYFVIEGAQLKLKNVPVPFKENKPLDPLRDIFGRSYLVHTLMDKLWPNFWYRDTSLDFRSIHNQPAKVAELLFNRLSELGKKNNVKILVHFNSDFQVANINLMTFTYLKKYIQAQTPDLMVFDSIPIFLNIKKHEPNEFNSLFHGLSKHSSPKGNALTAKLLKDYIKK